LVAWALLNLGDAHNDIGNYEKAQMFLNQSVLIFKKTFGEDNIRTAWALFQLGKVYINLGHIEKARNILEDCLVVYKKNNNRTGNILKSLGDLYLLEKNLEKAEDFLNKALETFRNDKSPLEYECLESFSELHLKKSQEAIKSSKLKEAERFKAQAMNDLKQALEIVKTHFPADSPHIARIQNKIKQLEDKSDAVVSPVRF
jgi:tetratricopeptide (TPR) repeat protein